MTREKKRSFSRSIEGHSVFPDRNMILHKMILPWSYRSKVVAEAKYLVFNTLDTWIFWREKNTKRTTFLWIESSEFFLSRFSIS